MVCCCDRSFEVSRISSVQRCIHAGFSESRSDSNVPMFGTTVPAGPYHFRTSPEHWCASPRPATAPFRQVTVASITASYAREPTV